MEETKRCPHCDAPVSMLDLNCPYCGSPLSEQSAEPAGPAVAEPVPEYAETPVSLEASAAPAAEKHENVIAGLVGALLFGLGGAALYFGLYQVGFIAGLCGLVIFVLANLGYGIFCGNKESVSLARIIICIVVTIALILLAEYFCLAFEFYRAVKDYGGDLSFTDCLRAMPELLKDKEVLGAVAKDLLIAFALSAIAMGSTVAKMFKDRKAKLTQNPGNGN